MTGWASWEVPGWPGCITAKSRRSPENAGSHQKQRAVAMKRSIEAGRKGKDLFKNGCIRPYLFKL